MRTPHMSVSAHLDGVALTLAGGFPVSLSHTL